ncbi:MAG: helix-turn-helix domain-containing protein [Ruminococcaceae bacterium]|nr:helix-turn-helix domain-containing protein [Oscillospiraceae bacterium]
MNIICKRLVSLYHPNGSSVKKHTHNGHELVYCLEGKGSAGIEDKRYGFSSGNFYITRRGTLHSEAVREGTRIIYFYFEAPAELVCEGMFADYEGTVLSLVNKLKTEADTNEVFKEEMTECLIKTVLIETARIKENGRPTLNSVLQYINENIEKDIDFRALAEKLHYSYERFRHLFKEHTGMSPHQYLITQRLEKAKFLLKLDSGASLTEISYNCGFSSSSHFAKAFRSKEGMSPSEYLNRNKS